MTYDALSDRWARGLSEANLRSLTSDYMRTAEGKRTDDMIDAYNEYKRREELGLLKEEKSQGMTLKSPRRARGNHSRK